MSRTPKTEKQTAPLLLLDAADELLRAADALRKRVHLIRQDYDHNTYQSARRIYKATRARYAAK
jgi:hypothetical protein